MQEELYKNYPKLRESGGSEFYRQGSGKILSYIEPPASGYTIPYLKYSYGIKSAIVYVVPIQNSLSMESVSIEEDEVIIDCIIIIILINLCKNTTLEKHLFICV